MRQLTALLLVVAAAVLAIAAPPQSTLVNAPRLPKQWEATTREIYQKAVEFPTVAGRDQLAPLTAYLAGQLRAAGWTEQGIRIEAYEATAGNRTAALIARCPAAKRGLPDESRSSSSPTSTWSRHSLPTGEPTRSSSSRKTAIFYGRGTGDEKGGAIPAMVALIKLRAAGFKPSRDIVLLFTGDQETRGKGAELGATD